MINYWFKEARKWKTLCRVISIAYQQRRILKNSWLNSKRIAFDHIDHLSPLPSAKKKYRYLFLMINAFTKFICLYPIKSTSIAKVLNTLMPQSVTFGNLQRIISDQEEAFILDDVDIYCQNKKMEQIIRAIEIPRGNGQLQDIN